MHRVIKFTQKDCLKQYIDINTEIRKKKKKQKMILKKICFNLMNNANFGKAMENVRKQR